MGTRGPRRRALPRSFFARCTERVARELIGCTLWCVGAGEVTAGRIVETEAYLDGRDPASHAARGPTLRSRIMFGSPGTLYVYLSYGMHHCLNLVTEREGHAGAVLLRALEPLVGLAAMRRRRRSGTARVAPRDRDLCAGPGRLGQALGVDLGWNGLRLGSVPAARVKLPGVRGVWVAPGAPPARLVVGPRIGIREAVDRSLRFCDPESSALSRPPGRSSGGSYFDNSPQLD